MRFRTLVACAEFLIYIDLLDVGCICVGRHGEREGEGEGEGVALYALALFVVDGFGCELRDRSCFSALCASLVFLLGAWNC